MGFRSHKQAAGLIELSIQCNEVIMSPGLIYTNDRLVIMLCADQSDSASTPATTS